MGSGRLFLLWKSDVKLHHSCHCDPKHIQYKTRKSKSVEKTEMLPSFLDAGQGKMGHELIHWHYALSWPLRRIKHERIIKELPVHHLVRDPESVAILWWDLRCTLRCLLLQFVMCLWCFLWCENIFVSLKKDRWIDLASLSHQQA